MEVNDSFLTNKLSKGLMWLIIEYTAPGSQNGFDNSGRRGNIEWQQGLTVNQTLDAIQALASRYVNDADVVAAIELLNEPFVARGVQLDPLKQFYYDGWGRIRQYSHDTTVVIHDGFLDPVSAWNGFMNAASGVWYVMLDTHHYEIFDSGQLQISTDQHIQAACSFGSNEVAKTDKWTIVGEWTGLSRIAPSISTVGGSAHVTTALIREVPLSSVAVMANHRARWQGYLQMTRPAFAVSSRPS